MFEAVRGRDVVSAYTAMLLATESSRDSLVPVIAGTS